jgi:hypothetical protein
VRYKNSELTKSEIYGEFLPIVMQGRVELLDIKQQTIELRQLERRTRSGGKDVVDHPQGLHDDAANAAAGACVLAGKERRRVRVRSMAVTDEERKEWEEEDRLELLEEEKEGPDDFDFHDEEERLRRGWTTWPF